MSNKVILTKVQRDKLEDLWMVFGNYGKKSNMPDHKFIQGILERGEDLRKFYKPTAECIEKVDAILK